VLKAEERCAARRRLRPAGWAVVNRLQRPGLEPAQKGFRLDADELAREPGNVKSRSTLVMHSDFALAVAEKFAPDPNACSASFAEIPGRGRRAASADKEKQMSAFLAALQRATPPQPL